MMFLAAGRKHSFLAPQPAFSIALRCHQLLAALNWVLAPGTVPVCLRCHPGTIAGYFSSGTRAGEDCSQRRKTLSLVHPAFPPGRGASSPEPTGSHAKAAGCCGHAGHQGLSQAFLAGLQSGWETLAQPQTSRMIKGTVGEM